jgi:hypothetical protein
MLFNANGSKIKNIPHRETWGAMTHRLSKKDFEQAYKKLDTLVEGKEINTAGWLPGKEWCVEFEPIWSKAAKENYELAGMMFGLLVWSYFMEREDSWWFGKYNTATQEVRSMTYFRIEEEV